MSRFARPSSHVAVAVAAAALASCSGGGGSFRASADFSGQCAAGRGTSITVFMTSNDVVRVDVRIEEGLLAGELARNDVEVDAMSTEVGPICACTCAPGEPLGTVVIESEGDVLERVDLGPAPDGCCESGP